MIIEFREAKARDARAIVPLLRERDLARLRSIGDPIMVIIDALQGSIASFAGTADGKVAVMWGLRSASLLSDQVYVWMLGTQTIDEYPVHFLRHSRHAMQIMRERYSLLYGECAADFERSIRWLTWLGAKVWAPNPEGGGRLVFAIEGDKNGS